MIRNFLDLRVYSESYEISLEIYKRTRSFPKEELYGLTSQLRRAVTSVPLNIAEGYGKRSSAAEFKRFLQMSIGSCNEIQVLLSYCKDLEYITKEEYLRYEEKYQEIGKMLYKLNEKWITLKG